MGAAEFSETFIWWRIQCGHQDAARFFEPQESINGNSCKSPV